MLRCLDPITYFHVVRTEPLSDTGVGMPYAAEVEELLSRIIEEAPPIGGASSDSSGAIGHVRDTDSLSC